MKETETKTEGSGRKGQEDPRAALAGLGVCIHSKYAGSPW